MKRALLALATALLVVTAGCAATPGTVTPTAADGATDGDGTSGDGATDGGADDTSSDRGAVNFYVSDEPNDMDDFEHLNVTITTVKFHLVDADNESAGDEENATTTTAATANGTDADDGDATETDVDEETEEREDDEMDDGDGEGEDGRWVTREVNATSVDLSQLRGANATLLQQFDLPSGEYDKVHMEVGDINGTLTNGESANVKLPSERLKLNSEFTVENGSEVDFVYDVTVHEAGNSGKYVLKPVVSESGTNVPIERVDDRDDRSERDDDDSDRAIEAAFAGNVTAGENVTVRVTENGSALANATVAVDGGPTGTTDADGEYVVGVPSDAEELEIVVESGDAEAELEAEFEGESNGSENGGPDDGSPGEGAGNGQGN